MRGNFTQGPTQGFVALLDAEGATRWQTNAQYTLGHITQVQGELLVTANNALLVLDDAGELRSRELAGSMLSAQLEATDVGTIALFTPGHGLIEATPEGQVLRRLDLGDFIAPWYHGGLCTGPDGAIAVTGTVQQPTDFGFLAQPLAAAAGALFVLHLAKWQSEPVR